MLKFFRDEMNKAIDGIEKDYAKDHEILNDIKQINFKLVRETEEEYLDRIN